MKTLEVLLQIKKVSEVTDNLWGIVVNLTWSQYEPIIRAVSCLCQ